MKLNYWNFASLINILGIFAYVFSSYGDLPKEIAVHFDIHGDADGYMHKGIIFIFPVLVILLAVLFRFLPSWDKFAGNYEYFWTAYTSFCLIMEGFMSYVTMLIIKWNVESSFDMLYWITPGLSIVLLAVTFLQIKCRRTQFVGFRTQWSLQNDQNWSKINKMGGYVCFVAAMFCLFSLLLTKWLLLFALIELLVGIVGIYIYSYRQPIREHNSRG